MIVADETILTQVGVSEKGSSLMTIKIKTQRLLLRAFVATDLDDYYEVVGDAQSAKAAGFEYAHSKEDAVYILKQAMKSPTAFAIVERASNRVIGSVGLYPRVGRNGEQQTDEFELGYILNPSYSGRGYMTEACMALIKATFEQTAITTLWASFIQGNQASKRVLEKLGFYYVDTFQHSATALYQPGAVEMMYRLDKTPLAIKEDSV